MENTYKDYDEANILFEKILLNYLSLTQEKERIEVNKEDSILFDNLRHEYSVSKSVSSYNWSLEEELADSLMFWISTGLISIDNNKYYIDSLQLQERYNKYNEYKNNKENITVYHKVKK